jgi:hypothetical protein
MARVPFHELAPLFFMVFSSLPMRFESAVLLYRFEPVDLACASASLIVHPDPLSSGILAERTLVLREAVV